MSCRHPAPSGAAHEMRLKTLVAAIQLSVIAGFATLMSPPVHAQTVSRSTVQQFDIPAGPLSASLTRLSTEAGIFLVGATELTQGKTTAGIKGTYDIATALSQLLRQTGLSFRFNDDKTVQIITAPPATGTSAVTVPAELGTITVVGKGNATTENTGSYTIGAMSTATKLPLSIQDTPQSLSVVTRQKMDDMGMQSVDDVAQNTTGLTIHRWSNDRPRYMSRGFLISSFLLDGLPVSYEMDTATYATLSMYDHVEVVRGPTGLMTGLGDPSGTVNFVRKRPTADAQYSVTTRAGSWSNYSGEVDLSRPLNEAGTLRGRFVTALQSKDNFTDQYGNRRQLYYGTLEADLTSRTTLSLGGSFNKENNPGSEWVGLPASPDGQFLNLPRSRRFSPAWTYWNKEEKSLFAELEHRFDNRWTTKIAGRVLHANSELNGTYLVGGDFDNQGAAIYDVMGGFYQYDKRQVSLDASAQGPFTLLGREHDLAFGVSHQSIKWKDDGFSFLGPGGNSYIAEGINPYTWNPESLVRSNLENEELWTRDQKTTLSSAYVTGKLNLADPLKLILGLRMDWYNFENTQKQGTWYRHTKYGEQAHRTPYAALMYNLNDNYTVYTSYSSIFKPQYYLDVGGNVLSPVDGTNYEVGLKASFLDERINAAVALFQTTQTNLPVSVKDIAPCKVKTNCYLSVGEVDSKGIDIDINGEILPRLNVGFGYTYTKATVSKDNVNGLSGQPYASYSPQHQLRMSGMYHLRTLNQWRIGGNIDVQSAITSASQTGTATATKQKAYAVAGMVVGYRATENLDIQLNINNLFDRRYYQSVQYHAGGNYFGAPRNFLLTAKMYF